MNYWMIFKFSTDSNNKFNIMNYFNSCLFLCIFISIMAMILLQIQWKQGLQHPLFVKLTKKELAIKTRPASKLKENYLK